MTKKMSIDRKRLKYKSAKENLGLTAIGAAGGWEVAIDETTAGTTQKWFAQIEAPLVYLCFAVQSPLVIDQMLSFLTRRTTDENGLQAARAPRNAEIVIGTSREETVTLVGDDEFADRYFLVAETKKKLVVRVTIGGTDLDSFVTALRQAKEDLDEADAV